MLIVLVLCVSFVLARVAQAPLVRVRCGVHMACVSARCLVLPLCLVLLRLCLALLRRLVLPQRRLFRVLQRRVHLCLLCGVLLCLCRLCRRRVLLVQAATQLVLRVLLVLLPLRVLLVLSLCPRLTCQGPALICECPPLTCLVIL